MSTFDYLIIATLIPTFLGIEFIILAFINNKFLYHKLDIIEGQKREESKGLANRIPPLLAATTASLAFLLSLLANKPELQGPILLVIEALAFLLISYQTERLACTKHIYYELQDRTVFYGLLSLTVGLALVYGSFVPDFFIIALIMPLSISLFHVREFFIDMYEYYDKKKKFERENNKPQQ